MEVVVLLSSGSSQPQRKWKYLKKEVRQPQEKIKRKKLENLLQTWDIIGGNLKLGNRLSEGYNRTTTTPKTKKSNWFILGKKKLKLCIRYCSVV